jgi:hypothetical protein
MDVAIVVATVNVEVAVPLAAGVTDVKLNPQVTVGLAGATEHDRPTDELKPFNDVAVIVEEGELPTVVVTEAGEALKLKSLTINP